MKVATVSFKMRGLYGLLALFGMTSATDFYITSPHSIISWKAGNSAKITWDIIPGGPDDISSVSVDIMDGDDSNAQVIMPIASGLSPLITALDWSVPADFPATSTVFIRVSGQGGVAPVYRYSHRFTIKGGDSQVFSLPSKLPQSSSQISASKSGVATTRTSHASTTTLDYKTSSSTMTMISESLSTESEPISSATDSVVSRQARNSSNTSVDSYFSVSVWAFIAMMSVFYFA